MQKNFPMSPLKGDWGTKTALLTAQKSAAIMQGKRTATATAAEIIAARWAEVDGLTATIKGATTAAPVVWLAGDTKPHEKEIEAAGGKWSGKKNAYYFRVA